MTREASFAAVYRQQWIFETCARVAFANTPWKDHVRMDSKCFGDSILVLLSNSGVDALPLHSGELVTHLTSHIPSLQERLEVGSQPRR